MESVTKETKNKFDALLKSALKSSNVSKIMTDSKDKLFDENDGTGGGAENAVFMVEESSSEQNKSFLLNRFLNSSIDKEKNSEPVRKAPVPKPRSKLKREEKESIDKEKQAIDKESIKSGDTFSVKSPKILKNPSGDESCSASEAATNKTYNIDKKDKTVESSSENEKENLNEIGDVIVHNSPTTNYGKVRILSSPNNDKTKKTDIEEKEDNLSDSSTSSKSKPAQSVAILTKSSLKYDDLLEITIHRTDSLKLTPQVAHPVIKCHLVEKSTGQYFKKSDPSRCVVFYYENDDTDYILPVMTHNYNLQAKRTLFPAWEEKILFNEDFHYLTNSDNLIIFFEILDFPEFITTSSKLEKLKNWHQIAFAFLIPNSNNCNRRLRLQLFHPQPGNQYFFKSIWTKKDTATKKCYLWDLWNARQLKKYPSTVYVTLKRVGGIKKVVDTFRSKTPLQREAIHLNSTADLQEAKAESKEDQSKDFLDNWKVKNAKNDGVLHLPNRKSDKIMETFGTGCFFVKISHKGDFLAAAVQINDVFAIVVYLMNNFEEYRRISCHQRLIYSLNWSFDDKLILSASGDNTCVLWNFKDNIFAQILPHPSFVYAAEFNCNRNTIATGCFDQIVRLWTLNPDENLYNLSQELQGHSNFITSLCFNKLSNLLYSSDGSGLIIEWKLIEKAWQLKKKIQVLDLKNVVINQILLIPCGKNEKKLLVHARDSTLRIVAIKNACVLFWLQGALNRKMQTFASISKCGSFVFCGSENGCVHVWDSKTGRNLKTYKVFPSESVHCVDFHTKRTCLVASSYGNDLPIIVYEYQNETNEDGGLKENSDRLLLPAIKKKIKPVENSKNVENFQEILKKFDEYLMK